MPDTMKGATTSPRRRLNRELVNQFCMPYSALYIEKNVQASELFQKFKIGSIVEKIGKIVFK